MLRKIIDDYRLKYQDDLFEIKLIFFGLSRKLQISQSAFTLPLRNKEKSLRTTYLFYLPCHHE